MTTSSTIQLGISTCPNDTFAFHALMTGKVDTKGLSFDINLTDVQELNDELLAGRYDVAKASFHAALMLADRTVVLPSGSALGFGNGPLLLSRHENMSPVNFANDRKPLVLCPGKTTTATLLYRLFHDVPSDIKQVVFSEIMPALTAGTADFGVCIHEGRFTWQDQGLYCVADLGEVWQQHTGQPLPLGGILARKNLGAGTIGKIQRAVHDSIKYGLAHRQETLPTMRKYAAEMSDEVLMAHVDLYVNEHTVDLGQTGRKALSTLSEMAARVKGEEAAELKPLDVFEA